jgi:hypothetical protein
MKKGGSLTNFHVVREASRVQVMLADSTEPLEARVVSVSEANDLALLQLKAKPGQKFRAVEFAEDDDLLLGRDGGGVGESVWARWLGESRHFEFQDASAGEGRGNHGSGGLASDGCVDQSGQQRRGAGQPEAAN